MKHRRKVKIKIKKIGNCENFHINSWYSAGKVDKYKEKYLSDSCPYRQKNIRAETLNDILKEKSQAMRQRKGKVVRPVTEEEYERLTTKTLFGKSSKSENTEERGIVRRHEILQNQR